MLGYHGINSAASAVATALGGSSRQFGMPHYPVKRMMRMPDLGEVVDLLKKLAASNGNYVMCDSSGIPMSRRLAGPEVLSDRQGLRRPHQSFLCSRYAKRELRASWKDSSRLDRINSLLAGRQGFVSGRSQGFLATRGKPTSICRTIAAAPLFDHCEPGRRRIHGRRQSLRKSFVTYSMS
jgi:hypothetical protein